jgi:hypothetical protein
VNRVAIVGCGGSGLSAWTCLWGIARRRLRYRGGQHKDIGVYDRVTWNFIRYILGYRREMAPRVRQLIADHAVSAEVVVLRNRSCVGRIDGCAGK